MGFTFYCGRSRKGMPYIMPKTSSKKFRQKIRDIKVWIYANRDQSLKKLMGMLNLKLVGHYRYYGISFNGRMISNYKQQVRELLFKVLNRRSDRKSYTREGFIEMLKYYPLAMPKIYVSLFWECKYYYEEPYAGKPHVRFCEGLTLRGVSLLDVRPDKLSGNQDTDRWLSWHPNHWTSGTEWVQKEKVVPIVFLLYLPQL